MHITIEGAPKKIFTKEFYGIAEAADLLGVHTNTLYRLCRTGELPAIKFHSAWRIPRASLEAMRVPEIRTGPKPRKKEKK